MPHIHTNPGEHDQTTSALIIRLDTPEPQLLLHKHKKYGRLMQPGGHIEINETPWQGVLHEILEETGYTPDQLQVFQPSNRLRHLAHAVLHPIPLCDNTHLADAGHYHSDRTYAFATDSLPNNPPDSGESTDFVWVTADQLESLPDGDAGSIIKDIGLYALNVCTIEWERVPVTDFEA
jgi:8-oxo-dGTP diphosphatase